MLGIITFINFSNLSHHKLAGSPPDLQSPAPDQRIQPAREQPAPHHSPTFTGPAVALGLNLIILSANLKPQGIRRH